MWARERFPFINEISFHWSGQVMETIDGLAFIGHNPLDRDNVYIATGDSGMGMTHGTIAGMMVVDLIDRHGHPWADLYSPSRKRVRAVGEYTREATNMAAQYADWVTGGDGTIEELARDSGTVVRRGLSKVAVYRDSGGELHECSAVCPHLAAIVHWNAAEHTWDCPCHGSRFDRFGGVISGPANRDLAPVHTHVTQ
jgi:Rieske Fe-S protein